MAGKVKRLGDVVKSDEASNNGGEVYPVFPRRVEKPGGLLTMEANFSCVRS
jgi:hypothetical protein